MIKKTIIIKTIYAYSTFHSQQKKIYSWCSTEVYWCKKVPTTWHDNTSTTMHHSTHMGAIKNKQNIECNVLVLCMVAPRLVYLFFFVSISMRNWKEMHFLPLYFGK